MNGKRIILIGPCGAGKSTVGRLLVASLGCRFVDLDSVRVDIYKATDYSEAAADDAYKNGGVIGWHEYIKPYEFYSVKSVLSDCDNAEIATVGMTAEQAAEAGYEVLIGKYLMPGNGKSIIEFQDTGFIKVIADAATGKILGAHLMCQRASDIVGEFGTAIANRMTYRDMLKAMKPHPSFAEGVQEALEALEGRSIHSAPVRK